MQTATSHRGVEFVAKAAAWSLSLFCLLRLSWPETHLVLPATQLQGDLAFAVFGAPSLPVNVSLACSGTDALALCLGSILAYPATWRSRLGASAGGITMIVLLNTIRIGTLGRAAASPDWFNALHLYVWPALLVVAIAGYVFWWMLRIDRRADFTAAIPQPSRLFVDLTFTFLLLFAVTAPLYLTSASVQSLGAFIALAAGSVLHAAGVSSEVSGNALITTGGVFFVTQECIATPLLPVYLAAVCAYGATPQRVILGIIAAVPLFVALGVVRLLLVALPDSVGSPSFMVHAFYQLLLGALVVYIAAAWRHGRVLALRYAAMAIALGAAFVYWLGPIYSAMVAYGAAPIDDPQGALGFMPVFQAGLYLALSLALFSAANWKAVLIGFAVLVMTQPIVLLVLHTIAEAGLAAGVPEIRAWAIAGPLLVVTGIAYVPHARG